MTWWEYVTRIAAGEEQAAIAKRAGVGQSMVSRWQTSTPRPENVATFARAYDRPVLEAFVAAGFLTPEEAGERPSAPPSLASLTDDELIDEVRRRMTGVSSEDRPSDAQKTPPLGEALRNLADPPDNVRRLTPKQQRFHDDALPTETAADDGSDTDREQEDDE